MQYRKLGHTGLEVSIMGFGGSSLGSAFEPIDEAEGVRAVLVAVDNGINLIDTAPFYGLTKAETVLGKALQQIPREKYLLATKVGRYGYQEKAFDFSAQRIKQSVDESLQRLGVDYVDFIQAHDIEFSNVQQIIEETLPALREVQEQGKARFVGITGLPLKLLSRVLKQVEVDQIQSYCHHCLNDTTLVEFLPHFENVAVLNSAPLAMRLLSEAGPPSWHPAPSELRAKCAEAARYCREHGGDISKLALQFAVSNPHIPVTITGMATSQQVQQNLRAIEEPIDEDLLVGVLEILKPIHNLTWQSGKAENN